MAATSSVALRGLSARTGGLASRRRGGARSAGPPLPAGLRGAHAAGAGKTGVSAPPASLTLDAAGANLPHPDKVDTGGEDAWFISQVGGGAIGVADGVGGWRESGVNPGDYSKFFMKEACAYVEGQEEGQEEPGQPKLDPLGALQAGHDKTRLPGSSTAVVLQLNPEEGRIRAANLGDSGFTVFRQGKAVFRSEPLQHYFDCPFQFGAYPEHVELTDTPMDAQEYNLPVKPGDIIIMGSDGLWDNVYEKTIAAMTKAKGGNLEDLAQSLAQLARKNAGDKSFESPYTTAAIAEGLDLPWWEKILKTRIVDGKLKIGRLTGGKMDDITVLAAVVKDQ